MPPVSPSLRERLLLLFQSPGFDRDPISFEELKELTRRDETPEMLWAALLSLAEEGVVEGDRDGYRLAPSSDEAPPTLRSREDSPVEARARFALMERAGRPTSVAEIASEAQLPWDQVFLALEDLADDGAERVERTSAGYYAWDVRRGA